MNEEIKINELAAKVIEMAKAKNLYITTAESCTGGLVSGALTGISGSSDVFKYGFVTYHDEAKTKLLGVDEALLEKVGAVSEGVAHAMATGALTNARADISISVTGIAGPKSDVSNKPVGLVHFSTVQNKEGTVISYNEKHEFGDLGRTNVRNQSVLTALGLLLKTME